MAVVLEVHAALMGYRSCRPSGLGGWRQVLLEHREVTGYLEQWRILIRLLSVMPISRVPLFAAWPGIR